MELAPVLVTTCRVPAILVETRCAVTLLAKRTSYTYARLIAAKSWCPVDRYFEFSMVILALIKYIVSPSEGVPACRKSRLETEMPT